MTRYKLYVGPTLVKHVAQVLGDAGYPTVEGTENVYFDSGDNRLEVLTMLRGLVHYVRYEDLTPLHTVQ